MNTTVSFYTARYPIINILQTFLWLCDMKMEPTLIPRTTSTAKMRTVISLRMNEIWPPPRLIHTLNTDLAERLVTKMFQMRFSATVQWPLLARSTLGTAAMSRFPIPSRDLIVAPSSHAMRSAQDTRPFAALASMTETHRLPFTGVVWRGLSRNRTRWTKALQISPTEDCL